MTGQSLAEEIQSVIVKERLHDLEIAYCRGIDRRDENLLRSIYFKDAIEDHGDAFYGTGYSYVEFLFGGFLDAYEITAHYVLNESYKVLGSRAEGEIHRISYHRERGSGRELTAASRTFNRYERRDGVWRISYRGVARDWIKESSAHSSGAPKLMELRSSRAGEDDISYTVLSMFGRGPLP